MGTRRLSLGCTFVQWSQLPVHAVFQVEPVLDQIATIKDEEWVTDPAIQTRTYLLSTVLSPERFNEVVRAHWDIENGLHWVLDVVFREDRSRIRAENAGANLAMIRRVAVSLLRRAPGKGSGVTKRLKAGWDDEYLLRVLQGITACIVR